MKKIVLFAFMPVVAALFIWACGEAEIVKDFADSNALIEKCVNNPTDPVCQSLLEGLPPTPSSSGGYTPPPGAMDSVKITISCDWANKGDDGIGLDIDDEIDPKKCKIESVDEGQDKFDASKCAENYVVKIMVTPTDLTSNETAVVPSTTTTVLRTYAGKYIYVVIECGYDRIPLSKDLAYRVSAEYPTLKNLCEFVDTEGNPVSSTVKWAEGMPVPILKAQILDGYNKCSIGGKPITSSIYNLVPEDYTVTPAGFPGTKPTNSTGNEYTYKAKEIICNGVPSASMMQESECKFIVNDGSCQVYSRKTELCGSNEVQFTGVQNTIRTTKGGKGCYYVKDIAFLNIETGKEWYLNGKRFQHNKEGSTQNNINGTNFSSADLPSFTSKVDDGYYIHFPNNIGGWDGEWGEAQVTEGLPECLYNNPVCDLSGIGDIKAGGSYLTAANNSVNCGSGTMSKNDEGTPEWSGISWDNPTIGTKNEIKVTATCNGTSEEVTCSGTPITVYPNDEQITDNLAFINGRNDTWTTPSKGRIFFIGETPDHNSGVTDAGDICTTPIAFTNSWGTGSVTTAGTISVTATCNVEGIGNMELTKITATVVPNPSLNGACNWSKNPASNAKGSKPQGVSLKDSYGRCNITDGVIPTTSYSSTMTSNNADGEPLQNGAWPADGMINWGIYTNGSVKTNVICTADITQKNCPELTINKGSEFTMGSEEPVAQPPQSNVTVGIDECIDISVNWNNQNYKPTLKVSCQPEPQFPNVSNTITITKNKEECGTGTGNNYALASCTLGTVVDKQINEWTVCVNSTLNGINKDNQKFKCSLGNN